MLKHLCFTEVWFFLRISY